MLVLDASVVNKLFLPNEADYEKALALINSHLSGKNEIIVPDLLFYEVANTLATKSNLQQRQVESSLNELNSYNFQTQTVGLELLIKTAGLAKKFKISIYDLVYLTVAEDFNCDLVTADEKFLQAVKSPLAISLSSHKI